MIICIFIKAKFLKEINSKAALNALINNNFVLKVCFVISNYDT